MENENKNEIKIEDEKEKGGAGGKRTFPPTLVRRKLTMTEERECYVCARKTTPAVFGIRLIQPPLLEKRRGACRVLHSFFTMPFSKGLCAANCLLEMTRVSVIIVRLIVW